MLAPLMRRVAASRRAVLMYAIRLADRCGVDLEAAVAAKLAKNKAKYPAELCKGSSAKYTAYASADGAAAAQQ